MTSFTASDGTVIAYEDIGAGSPLLLLHGLMAHGGFFQPQRELASHFRVITPDLRGHGRSSAGADATVERLASDMNELIQALDLDHVVVVGWSLGASVLWKMLDGAASAKIVRAVVIDMTPRVLNAADWQLGLSGETCEARRVAIRDDFPAFARAAGRAIFAQPVSADLEALAEWAGEEFARNDPAVMAQLWQSLVTEDFRDALGRMAQPALVIHGAHSHLYGSETAEYLARHLPDAKIVRFEDSGHAPHLEQPQLFNTTLRDFAAAPARPLVTTDRI